MHVYLSCHMHHIDTLISCSYADIPTHGYFIWTEVVARELSMRVVMIMARELFARVEMIMARELSKRWASLSRSCLRVDKDPSP